jgi:hypothetical protein
MDEKVTRRRNGNPICVLSSDKYRPYGVVSATHTRHPLSRLSNSNKYSITLSDRKNTTPIKIQSKTIVSSLHLAGGVKKFMCVAFEKRFHYKVAGVYIM